MYLTLRNEPRCSCSSRFAPGNGPTTKTQVPAEKRHYIIELGLPCHLYGYFTLSHEDHETSSIECELEELFTSDRLFVLGLLSYSYYLQHNQIATVLPSVDSIDICNYERQD